MSRKSILAAMLMMLVTAGESAAQTKMTIGAGVNQSCGKWLAERTSRNFYMMSNWALGFMSGVAIYSDYNPLNNVDADAVDYWLDNYCRARPTERFIDAVKAFISNRVGDR